jgi:cell division protease FtsH
VINEGAILAARREKQTIGMVELEDAIDRVLAGPETRSRVIASDERARIAYHESGHAVMMHYLKDHPPLQRVTIVRHGMSGGYTRSLGDDDFVVSRNELKATLAAALGGHAAEQVLLGEVASGAEDDLATATDIACRMIKRYGMSERLGPVCLGEVSPRDPSWRFGTVTKNYSERTAETIDGEIQSLIHEGYQQAVAILTEHRAVVDRLAAALLQYETLEGEPLERVFTDRGLS